jgi:hypothetical protein
MAELEQTVRRGQAPAFVWWAMCAGPLAWAADLGFSYVLARYACSTGHEYVLHAITILCGLIALSGVAAAWSAYSAIPEEASDKGQRALDRTYFQILFGIVFSIAFTVVIIAGAVPRWILSPCD